MTEPAFLLDTNICIYALMGVGPQLRRRMAEQDQGTLAISAITLAELCLGRPKKPEQEEQLFRYLEAVEVLPFDTEAANHFVRLPFRRGSFDRLIAAHALSRRMILVTNNERDFADVPVLKVENWTR